MTIPTRPAPAPPSNTSHAQSANAQIEQLRMQLEQESRQQRQGGAGEMPKLTIKLPPPPKRPTNNGSSSYNNNFNYASNGNDQPGGGSSITRKFPKARYAPSTNWDDSPFEGVASANSATTATTHSSFGGNFKKVPPPRPPPPQVQVNGRRPTGAGGPPTGILNNIFHRKKNAAKSHSNNNSSSATMASRVYGVSSGNAPSANGTSYTSNNNSSNFASTASYSYSTSGAAAASWSTPASSAGATYGSTSTNWTANWSAHATPSGAGPGPAEGQLISFDSPPSSPTFTQKSNSDCVSVDSFSSESNFSSPQNGSVSQPESGFEDDFGRGSRPATTSPLDPWETADAACSGSAFDTLTGAGGMGHFVGTAPVRTVSALSSRHPAAGDNPLCNGRSLLPPPPSLAAPTIIKPKISQKPKAPRPPMLLRKPGHLPPSLQYDGGDATAITPPSPPMPFGPPPPAPTSASFNGGGGVVSILDVISGKADALQLGAPGHSSARNAYNGDDETPYGIALYDFDGVEADDLSFRENDKIHLLEQVSEEWYRGRTRNGCEGIFPGNYVDIKVPLRAAVPAVAANGYQQAPADLRACCMYNFPAQVEGDLELKENDIVNILYRINEDWLFGEINNRQGQFPANFLEHLPEHIPTMPC